jgi:hypothetical protein
MKLGEVFALYPFDRPALEGGSVIRREAWELLSSGYRKWAASKEQRGALLAGYVSLERVVWIE